MDSDGVWRTIDAERLSLADLLDDLSDDEWETPSLCAGWRVKDVAAHLTLAHMSPATALHELVRARSFHRAIRDTAVRQASLPGTELSARLRSMTGSRRTAPGVTPLEPMLDLLVHGQDIVVPLGRTRPVPRDAAAAAASRAWDLNWPFRTRRRLRGLRLVASDVDWQVGRWPEVRGPIAALLLLVTGRGAAHGALAGDGAAQLVTRG